MNLFKKVSLLGLLSLSSQVLATPGVYEINSACLDVGCFSGDDPTTRTVEITQRGGTFRLTSDIFVGLNDPVAIIIDSNLDESMITLDLNGFSIRHSSNSDVDAIEVNTNNSVVTIKNGSIRGFLDGIVAVRSAVVNIENMAFRIMRDDAIVAGRGRIINNVFDCNRWGINALNLSGTFVGDRLYLENNDFTCLVSPDDQDPVFSMGATNICKDNRIHYDAGVSTNFESCTLVGDNFCNGSICVQGNAINSPAESKE